MKLLAIAALVCLTAGCDTKGTCLVEHHDAKHKNSECMVNHNKRACGGIDDSSFFEEDSAAGMARCHAAGFDVALDREGEQKMKNDQMVMFFKQ